VSDADAAALQAIADRFGIGLDVLRRSIDDGTVDLVLLEHLAMPEPARYTQGQIEEASGLGDDARRFWRALGFPDPDPDELLFTAEDLEMLQFVEAILGAELATRQSTLQLTRVLGQSMQRIAQTQIEVTEARVASTEPGTADPADVLARAEFVVALFPRVFEYAWRRHLQSAIRRRLADDMSSVDGTPPRGWPRSSTPSRPGPRRSSPATAVAW
jgi:adenylate cyclase